MASSNLLVSGRCRLYGAAVALVSGGGATTAGDRVTPTQEPEYDNTLARTTVVMKNGSSSGSELFSFAIPVGYNNWSCGKSPYVFMFGNGYIEFDSGIYIDTSEWDDNSGVGQPIPAKTNVYVYYEGA